MEYNINCTLGGVSEGCLKGENEVAWSSLRSSGWGGFDGKDADVASHIYIFMRNLELITGNYEEQGILGHEAIPSIS